MDEETRKRWLSKEPIHSNTYKRDNMKTVDKVEYLKAKGYFPPDGTDITPEGERETPDRVKAKGGRKLE